MSDELRLRLDGPAHQIDARAARDALTLLLRFLRSLANSDENVDEGGWNLSGLAIGSVDCAVRPADDVSEVGVAAVNRAWSGVKSLSSEAGIPDGWNEVTVTTLIDLAKLTRFRGVQEITLQTNDSLAPIGLTESVRANAERSLSVTRESLGSVRGEVVRYVNDSKKRELRIREWSTDELIRVRFRERLTRPILQAMVEGKAVQARGLLRRNALGQKIEMLAESVSAVDLSENRRSARDMVGVLGPDWTGGESSEEWLGWQRGR